MGLAISENFLNYLKTANKNFFHLILKVLFGLIWCKYNLKEL